MEDIPFRHCYDIDEIVFRTDSLIVVDCAVYNYGVVIYNEFLFINLTTKAVTEDFHMTDVFVDFNIVTHRRI